MIQSVPSQRQFFLNVNFPLWQTSFHGSRTCLFAGLTEVAAAKDLSEFAILLQIPGNKEQVSFSDHYSKKKFKVYTQPKT